MAICGSLVPSCCVAAIFRAAFATFVIEASRMKLVDPIGEPAVMIPSLVVGMWKSAGGLRADAGNRSASLEPCPLCLNMPCGFPSLS